MGWKVIQLALTQPLFKNYIMKNKFPWYFRIPLLFFGIWGLMEFFIDGGDMPAFIAYPITQAFLVFILLLLIGIELILNAIENVMFQTLSPEHNLVLLIEPCQVAPPRNICLSIVIFCHRFASELPALRKPWQS